MFIARDGAVASHVDADKLKALTSSELLKSSAQQLVEDINSKRKRDTAVLEGLVKFL